MFFQLIQQQNQNLVQSKLQLVKNPHGKEGVGLAVQRKGVQVGVLPHAAKQPNTIKLIPPTKVQNLQYFNSLLIFHKCIY